MFQQENIQPSTEQQSRMAMLQMVTGYWVSQAVYVAAKLGIADLLKDGPKGCLELAGFTQVNPRSLYRLMRALASVGVFNETEQGCFTLTPLATCLQSHVPDSLRALAIRFGEEHYRAWGDLLYSLQTEKSAFEHVYGMPMYQYHAQHPEVGKIFDEALTSNSAIEIVAITARYDFSQFHKLVDVGGGHGSLIAAILSANPQLQGILFEQPSVIEGARDLIEAQAVSKRCELVAGDCFESVPRGGDAYLLKHIIHNWDDERALTILRNCHRAMTENGKLLVIERVVRSGKDSFVTKFMDLNMLVMLGGYERTEAEYQVLFKAAGFQLTKSVATPAKVSVLEGVRV